MVANLGGNLIWVAKFRAFRGYSNPIFKTVPSYLSMGRKFGNRGSLFISLIFCRISLAARWYCNLRSHPQACSLSPRGHHGHPVAQKNFKWLLLRIRRINNFQLSRMHLKGICWEVDSLFPIWKTVMPERKRKKEEKPNRTPILWVDFLRGESFWSLSYSVLFQPRARHLLVSRQIARLKCDSLLETESLGRSKQVSFLRIGSLGRSRHVYLLGLLNWWIPDQIEAWQTSEGQIPRQVNLLGPPDWNSVSPSSPAWPVVSRIKGL